jgi:hypothetical protein
VSATEFMVLQLKQLPTGFKLPQFRKPGISEESINEVS